MVCDDTHSDIRLSICPVFDTRQGSDRLDHRSEDIGIVVRSLALHRHTETLEAHPRVDDTIRQGLERTISLAVVLHEDEVPDLDDLWVALIDERKAVYSPSLLVGANIYMDLGARTAGALVTHLPEVVVLIAVDDPLLG